jgi:hypothetical protein
MRGSAGVAVAQRGAGIEGGIPAAAIERIKGLIPIRDALREVYGANLADDAKAGDESRKRLNASYDKFVREFGPINKTDLQSRRPLVGTGAEWLIAGYIISCSLFFGAHLVLDNQAAWAVPLVFVLASKSRP